MAIKIEMLRCFMIAARAGNLADAADKLGRTQSAVSMMLKQFEAHLDEALFETDRKSKLTSLGAFVLEEASREIDHFDTTVTAIQNFARSQSGLVRIAAVPSVAAEILPLAVRSFLTEHPKVQVDIRDMDSVAVIRELEREQVDIGLATVVEPRSNISSRTLFTDSFGVICPVDHPLAQTNTSIDWEDIEEWPLIANGICQQITDIRFQKYLAKSSLMVRNTTSLIAMVRSGVGITILPRLAVANNDQIAFVHVNDPTAHRRMDILSNTHTSLSPAAKSFEEAVYATAHNLALVVNGGAKLVH